MHQRIALQPRPNPLRCRLGGRGLDFKKKGRKGTKGFEMASKDTWDADKTINDVHIHVVITQEDDGRIDFSVFIATDKNNQDLHPGLVNAEIGAFGYSLTPQWGKRVELEREGYYRHVYEETGFPSIDSAMDFIAFELNRLEKIFAEAQSIKQS